jgi:hypothetical protein
MRFHRVVLVLNDEQLEQFVRDWIARATVNYVEVQQFSGAGYLGRDVVGFLTDRWHEGRWRSYQF